MRKAGKLLLFIMLCTLTLAGAAFAAQLNETSTGSGTYHLEYSSGIINGNQYIVLTAAVTQTDGTYSITAGTIKYIDQVAAANGKVVFDLKPMTGTDKAIVLLGGAFDGGTSPRTVGTIGFALTGVAVSGNVTSNNPKVATTIELYAAGTTTNPTYTTTIAAVSSGNGQQSQSFSFSNVVAGTYDLLVTKPKHVPYKITGVVVGDTALDLTQNANTLISTIALPYGDITSDKKVNISDLGVIIKSTNFGKAPANATNPEGELTGDDRINISDLGVVIKSANFGKQQSNCTVVYS